MSGGYVIQVGNERPAEAIIATPNKKTGEPQGAQMKTYIRVGSHLVLNQCRVWGRRVMKKDGKIVTSDIEFNTPGYKGDIEFMNWGADGGYAIEVRYLDQSRSLDFEYQTNIQKIVINPEQQGAHIILSAGQNKFDHNTSGLKIKFLGVHPQNRDSKSKNPDPAIKGYVYYEVTDAHVDRKSVEAIETSLVAGNFVKEISVKPQQIRNLFQAIGPRDEFNGVDLLSSDAQLYKTLLEYANYNSVDFFYLIGQYKARVSDAFKLANSYRALDLTKDGHIVLEVNGKKEMIMSGLKGKGEEMAQWMVDNYYEEEVFKATQIFLELVLKLK